MQHSSQNGDPIDNARHVATSRRARRAESGAAVVLAALLGAVAVGAVGCDGDDTTDFPQGGSSGSGAGRSGAAGTTAGASGSSGSAGASGAGAGGSSAGTSGAGGSSAGTGGTSAGTGGSDDPDGGTDSGVPDAGPDIAELRAQWAQQICDTGAELDGCEQAETCAESVLLAYDFIDPTCSDEADAYFACVAAQPVTSYECAGDPASPNFIAGTPPCDDEQVAFDNAFIDPPSCAD